MKKVQLNFTERAARSLNTDAKLRITNAELYDLYTHPEDMSLYVQIVGDDSKDIPDVYIYDVTLETLRYTLSQLSNIALNNSLVWLRAYDGGPLHEFAVGCDSQYEDFGVNGCSFRLYDFTEWTSSIDNLSDNTLVCHEEETVEAYYKIMNIINNNNN